MKHGATKKKSKNIFSKQSTTVIFTFLLSVLAFGMVFIFPLVTKQFDQGTSNEPQEVLGTTGKQRTVWVLFHDNGTLIGTVAVIGDTRTVTLQTVGVPVETQMNQGTRLLTLQEAFENKGETAAAELAKQMEWDADGVICLSIEAATECVRRVSGNLPYTLPEPVGRLPASSVTLTPLQVADVLRYNEWSQKMSGRAEIYAQLVALFLEKALKKDAKTVFGVLTDVADSRLHISQFAAVEDDLKVLADTSCTVGVAAGRQSGDEKNPCYVLYH